ncbi:uncharacterized protein LOC116212526 [Punica granatum]|uniref:Uncharacterized protein n=2 Tax=Punica granatum TaxID=22663 RepID=A0A218W8G8_PUNGR|nr:uncharacterized protein LOC116212526 [Punica granatum]OWM68789.1 hypothetical protein CDL15_Pgr024976 [Punica granatum]PKI35263.1 hypothetical protein CRG98_044354 [Punica granatum]
MASPLCLSSSASPLHPSLPLNLRPPNFSKRAAAPFLTVTSPASFSCRRPLLLQSLLPNEVPRKIRRGCTASAAAEDALSSPSDAQQMVSSSGDDGVYTIISVLLLIAFIGLSVLTIGVIYIGVTDFLQKREREKFEKEEAAKKKKGGKKVKVRARAGPRGFGQKTDVEDEFDD